jgi:hypothetical protein
MASLLLVISAASSPAAAQLPAGAADRFALETEPLLLTQQGGSLSFLTALDTKRLWSVAASVHAADLTDGIRDNFFRDADALDVRLAWAAGLDLRRRLSGTRSGWFAGIGAGIEAFRASLQGTPDDEQQYVFVAPHVGYVWLVGGSRFFVYPRATVIGLIDNDRERTIGGITYELRPLVPNLQLRVGAHF